MMQGIGSGTLHTPACALPLRYSSSPRWNLNCIQFCVLSLEQKLRLNKEHGKYQHAKENNLRTLVAWIQWQPSNMKLQNTGWVQGHPNQSLPRPLKQKYSILTVLCFDDASYHTLIYYVQFWEIYFMRTQTNFTSSERVTSYSIINHDRRATDGWMRMVCSGNKIFRGTRQVLLELA